MKSQKIPDAYRRVYEERPYREGPNLSAFLAGLFGVIGLAIMCVIGGALAALFVGVMGALVFGGPC